MKKNQKGFTLVELMIVVAIIGILAAIAIPKFADMLEKSREGATKGNQSALRSAISIYISDQQGVVPNTLSTASVVNGGVNYPAFLPNYITPIPPVKATAKKNLPAGAGSPSGTLITYGSSPSAASVTLVTTGWLFDELSGNADLWVNNRSYDMAGRTYTLFGYE